MSFKETLDKFKKVEIDLKFDVKKYQSNQYLANLELKEKEVLLLAHLLEKKIQIDSHCPKDATYCLDNNYSFHIDFKRNENDKIVIYYYRCPNQIETTFLYNSYANTEISKTTLTKDGLQNKNSTIVEILDVFKKNFIANKKHQGLYIWGDFGVGKTHLSFAMASYFSKKNKTVTFVSLQDVLAKAKLGFNNEQKKVEFEYIIDSMFAADVLFIDDFGAENAAEWFLNETFINILNSRSLHKKLTFFNSNYNLSNLEKVLIKKYKSCDVMTIKRIMDRIKALVGNKAYAIKGENYRY